MNGNWYPWSTAMGHSTPQDFISVWHHIHAIFSNKSLDSTRLQWIWCVNNADAGGYHAENYWVGNDYTDWQGIDGYNFGISQSGNVWTWPNQTYDRILTHERSLSSTKPICINEYGTTNLPTGNISDIPSKLDWLTQFCDFINNKNIKMASYFNTKGEKQILGSAQIPVNPRGSPWILMNFIWILVDADVT